MRPSKYLPFLRKYLRKEEVVVLYLKDSPAHAAHLASFQRVAHHFPKGLIFIHEYLSEDVKLLLHAECEREKV